MTLIKLRDYQTEAVEAVEAGWASGLRRPAVVLPTGAGKTVVFAGLIERWLDRERRQAGAVGRVPRRALVLAHRDELITQAAGKLADVAPGLRVGVVKAARNQTLADVVVASVQTLARPARRREMLDVGLVVVDEAHHATATSYVATLGHFGALEVPGVDCGAPGGSGRAHGAVAVGFTATMSRSDDHALGDVWEDVVYEKSIAWMINHDPPYLVRPRGLRVRVHGLDLAGVKRTRGDYRESDLGQALEDSLAPEAVAKAMLDHVPAGGRPTILFAPTVRSAQLFQEALDAVGYATGLVTGAMKPEERAKALDDFRHGRIQVLCNCMVLTEGTDLPMASCAVIARPTRHAGLYVQMVGRVLRLWPGKDDALVLDVVGASARHGLSSDISLFGERSIEDGAPVELDEDNVDLIDDGEILLDTVGQAIGAADVDDPSWVNGPLSTEIVDLFHGSDSAWMRTRGGIWFLEGQGRFLALIGAAAYGRTGYDVVQIHQTHHGASTFLVQSVSRLDYAMAFAEGAITKEERAYTKKKRSWRSSTPSDKMRYVAQTLGIIPDGMTTGELSALISVGKASLRIDPHIRPGMET